MLRVFIPNNNLIERKYIIDILLFEFLGLEYKIEIKDIKDYEIVLGNRNKLIVEDHFFSKFPKDLEYLKKKNIPNKVEFSKNDFIVEENIPIVYGINKLIISDKTIRLGIDVFASSFFMLTRWEEYVNKNRDSHNRFPATESLAYKQGFLDRPIVNEYVEILKKIFLKLGLKQKLKIKSYQVILTHDVDEVRMWKSWKQVARVALGDMVKRKSLFLAIERFSEYFLIQRGKIKDPFDTFEWLMDKSEAIGVKSRFYFMSGGVTEFDNRYDIRTQKEIIKNIQKRGHLIGIHPSYNAYNNFEQFKKEKELLEEVCECKIDEGREHYLRFDVPTTWQIWEDNKMMVDSTCGYADREGFRCGTGDEFSVFNILTREKLKLKERPLIYMDDNRLKDERIYDENILIDNITKLKRQSFKYNSKFTLLFHQNIFTTEYINYKDIYETVIK